MPNGGSTAFPKFPTLFGEEEQERLKQLQEQEKQMKQLWQQKFAPETWAKVSVPEKFMREWIAPTSLPKKAVQFFTPWEWGFDYGFTPEQFREKAFEVAAELKELERKQGVVGVLPLIQETLRLLALADEPVVTSSASEADNVLKLEEIFKLDKFNKEEKGFVVKYAMSLIGATPEQLLGGEPWGVKPVTPEELEYLRQQVPIDPRFILSTVAFSKDTAEITEALRLAYPPQGEADIDTRLEKILKAYAEKIGKQEGETNTDAAKRLFEQLSEQGQPIALIDKDSGNITIAQKKLDGTVQGEDKLLGFDYEGAIVPIAQDGEPIADETILADKLKAIGNKLYLGAIELAHASKQYILSYLPEMIFSSSGVSLEEQVKKGWITQEQANELKAKKDWRPWAKSVDKMNEEIVNAFRENYQRRELEHQEWIATKHKEFTPVPEWEKPVLEVARENPKALINPIYWVYLFSESAIFTGAFLGASISVGLLTRNPAAGMAAGVAVTTPLETKQLVDELISVGVSQEQAVELGLPIGALIGSVEMMGGTYILKAILPSVFRTLKREVQREVVRATVRQLALKGLKTFTTIDFMEAMEEVLQEAIHNATVRWFDETKDMFGQMPEIFVRTILATLPLGIFGGSSTVYHEVKNNLPKETQDKIDSDKQKLVDAGLKDEQAELISFVKVLETETGQAQVEQAQEKAEEQVVPQPGQTIDEAKAKKITNLEKKLEITNKDIKGFEDFIKELESEDKPSEGIKEALDELIIKKKAVIKAIEKLQRPVVKPIISEVTPVIRMLEEGEILDFTKPHGLYFTVGEISPHKDIGVRDVRGIVAGKNVLDVPQIIVKHKRFGVSESGEASAGIAALQKLVGETEFNRLLKLEKPELVKELSARFPGPDYTKYFDSYELLEAYAGQMAREKGYDAILQIDKAKPEFSEYVALTQEAVKIPVTPTVPAIPKVISAKPLAPEVTKGLTRVESRAGGYQAWVTSDQGVEVGIGNLKVTFAKAQTEAIESLADKAFIARLEKAWANKGYTFKKASGAVVTPTAPAVEIPKAKPPAQEVTEANAELQRIVDKWLAAKTRNAPRAEADLAALEKQGFEVSDARDALQEYRDIVRADFDTAEDFSEARTEAWENFTGELEGIEQPVQELPIRKVGEYEVTKDDEGRTIICG